MSTGGMFCVFAKAPVAGRVKTRLIPELGAERAAQLAAAGLLDTWALVTRVGRARLLLDGPAERLPVLAPHPQIQEQAGGDLGERLGACFGSLLGELPWVIATGTDSPGLAQTELESAARWLSGAQDQRRAVLGPCADGGYYLLGISAWQNGLLDNLPWSQPTTLDATRQRLLERGYALHETVPYFDVDEAADLERLVRAAEQPGFDAPATRALLRAWSDRA